MGSYAYDKNTGTLTTLATSGQRTWVGTKAQHDAARTAGTLPNGALICITDDEVDNCHYSTDERETGMYWIDGKPIYKITFIVNNPTVGDYFNINGDVDFSNCNLKNISGILTGISGSNTLEWKIPYYFASTEYVNIFRSDNNIRIKIASNYTISKAEVTVEYTKNTD